MGSMEIESAIQQIRSIRDISRSINLKPSPYFKSEYTDEYGGNHQVALREYQKHDVMNLLMVERMIDALDTGLGKTIEILATISYIWLKEPHYTPIIITTKSSLYQWASEIEKFFHTDMMEPIVIYGEPFKRHELYKDFFSRENAEKKRLLLLTYDNVMYDMEPSVIREKARNPRPGFNAEFKRAKEDRNQIKLELDALVSAFKDLLLDYPEGICIEARRAAFNEELTDFVVDNHHGDLPKKLYDAAKNVFEIRRNHEHINTRVLNLTNEKTPSKTVPGIYNSVVAFKKNHPKTQFLLVMDEMHKLKNHKSQFHEKVRALSLKCDRLVGMTATPIKNRLMEFWALFRIIQPSLFPKITHFQNQFCIIKLIKVPGGRQVPIIIGYKNLEEFNRLIEPFYLTRKKYEVAKELPELLSREIECELSSEQEELYDMAESGLLASVVCKDLTTDDSSNDEILKSMTLCQQAADAPQLILDDDGDPFDGSSSKIDALLDLIQGEADGQKMIVFSRFEKMISLIENKLKDEKIKCVRITGKETSSKVRQQNRELFQNPKSGIDVILITTAGSESLNLQSAEHFVFVDLPWSFGDYIQLIGRMVRIGSSYATVVAHHLLSRRRSGSKTIDHHVLKALRSKMSLADTVSGVSLQDGLQFSDEDMLKIVFSSMRSGEHKSDNKDKREALKLMAKMASPKKKKKQKLLLESEASKPSPQHDPFEGLVNISVPDLSDI